MEQKVAEFVADFLVEKNISKVFGIIGSGIAHIFDAVGQRPELELICVHHEQAAVMAMIAHYRITGTMAATLLTTGAGSTNSITGVLSAWMDSVPGLLISGNENSKFTTPENKLRIWGVQGYESAGMVEGITKSAQRVMEAVAVRRQLETAYHTALSGRPGPSWLDIPMNVQGTVVDSSALLQPDSPDIFEPSLESDQSVALKVKEILELIRSAKRPLLWLGHGIRLSGAVEQLDSFLDSLGIPALVSWAGIDMIDSEDPRVFGRAGVYGQRYSNFILQNCDFLLCIGTRLALPQVGYDISELARTAKVVAVDIDQLELDKYKKRFHFTVCSDAKVVIEALIEEAQDLPDFTEWFGQCRHYREQYPVIGPEHDDMDGYINSYRFMDRLSDALRDDDVVVTDMGTALISGHQVLRIKKGQRLLTSTGLGEMGFGLPAAIGASLATGRKEVICLNCDGGMMLNLQELQTLAHHKLPVKLFIFNNDGYLMIKHTQKALLKGRQTGVDVETGVSCPDYSKLAAAFGFPAFQVKTWEDYETCIPQVLAEKGPVICEVFTHPRQPLVPKLSLAPQPDGTIVSPPLEDLSPLIPRQELRASMIIPLHNKSEKLKV